MPFALVALGGAVGTLCRYVALLPEADPRLVVLALNVLGSLVLGALVAVTMDATTKKRQRSLAFGGLGVCGGMTTFSTHVVDVARELDDSFWLAGSSALGTALVAVAASGAGYALMERKPRPGER